MLLYMRKGIRSFCETYVQYEFDFIYKTLPKVIGNSSNLVIQKTVPLYQTGAMRGRSIGKNMRTISDVLSLLPSWQREWKQSLIHECTHNLHFWETITGINKLHFILSTPHSVKWIFGPRGSCHRIPQVMWGPLHKMSQHPHSCYWASFHILNFNRYQFAQKIWALLYRANMLLLRAWCVSCKLREYIQ